MEFYYQNVHTFLCDVYKKIITIEKHNIYGQHVFTQQDTRFEILLRPFSARPLKIVNDYELATYLLFNSLPVMNKTNWLVTYLFYIWSIIDPDAVRKFIFRKQPIRAIDN